MNCDNNLFINKFQPIFFSDFGIDNNIIDLLDTLILMDSLNILIVGDIASGKTSLLNAIIREYYKGIPQKKYDENLNDIMKVNEIVYQEQRKNYKENVEYPICEIPNISPYPVKLEYPDDFERCVGGNTHGMNLCSGPDTQENPMHYPVPGPQWLPQSAETVQTRLFNNDYW